MGATLGCLTYILKDLEGLVDQAQPGDTILSYFAGHGHLENDTYRQAQM